jgi:general secretion pathway protein D
VKTKLLVSLLFIGASTFGQIPPPPANPPAAAAAPAGTTITPGAPGAVSPGSTPGGTAHPGAVEHRATPRPTAPLRRDSIIVPSDAAEAGDTVITPSGTNAPPEELIPAGMIDLRGADLNQVLLLYADLVNKTILRAANLGEPKFNLTTKTPLTKTEARQALEATLGLNGIAIVPFGEKFVKASQLPAAGAMGAEFSKLDPTKLPFMGQFITEVIQLKYVKPTELVQLLQPFSSGVPNAVFPIESSQIIVLRDLTENVKRMLELVHEIDVSVPSEFISEVIPIKYAKATEIANALNSLSSGGGNATVGGGSGTGSRTSTRTGSSGFGAQRSGYGGTGMGTGGYPGSSQPGMLGGGIQPPTSPQGTAGGNTFASRLNNLMQRAAGGTGEIVVLGQTKMIADERTNALLIYASRADMDIIKEIIKKLDVVLAQVLIEAVIIEVNLNDAHSLGVSYLQHPLTSGKATGVGSINNNSFLNDNNFVLGAGSNATGALPSGFSYLFHWNQDLDVALTAVASDSRARILQRPRIQTSHNEPATLFVGESRPYPTASYYGGGAYGGYSSIQQLQIGVTLEVTPLINPDGLVVMDIHQTIESANGSVNIVNVGDVPVTSRKEAIAKVSVRDRDTIILGGLIETSKNKVASGVPFLKDIPVLGYAFRSTSEQKIRNELIVLIRPTVLPTPEIAALAARREKMAMPLVRQLEKEIQKEDARHNHQENKDLSE